MSKEAPKIPKVERTWVDLLRARASSNAVAYTFLSDGDVESAQLTHGELDTAARGVAAVLQEAGATGQRALLLYPPGLDFVVAFLGCLYAAVTAVPAYPPRRHKIDERLRAIASDCRPSICLTTASIRRHVEAFASQSEALARAAWIATDTLDASQAESWREAGADRLSADTLAFVQYTSGSTGSPKGVLVRHGHLLHNQAMIRQAFGHDEETLVVGWLPLYHDMGLIGNVLQPLYLGGRCVLMSPMAFLQKPLRWLAAISRYGSEHGGATTSGGPNFAYELCVERIREEERQHLDLSRWRLAFNGAEPVRAATLERFAEAFAPCGFRRHAFYPCYGLAEATLFVTGGRWQEPPAVRAFDPAALERNRAVPAADGVPLVSCGHTWRDQELAIVDPSSRRRLDDGTVGEIWVRGASVAGGYFEKAEATARDFAARLDDGPPWLRTGDLGFLHGGELQVTGRSKDLIILRGRNLHPHDLEAAAEASHPALRAGSSAAFSIDVDGEERLALVLELERRAQASLDAAGLEAVVQAVRQTLAESFAASPETVVLIKTGTLLKTSSGKIRRRAVREAWRRGELRVVGELRARPANTGATTDDELLADTGGARREPLVGWLHRQAARVLGLPVGQVPAGQALTGLGLDSLRAMELRGRIEEELGTAPEVAAFLDGASVDELAAQILAELEEAEGAALPEIPMDGPTEGEHPLSFGQEALFFLHRLAPASPAYNIAAAARLRGSLDEGVFGRAFALLTERHPMLRTRFTAAGDDVVQEVLPAGSETVAWRLEDTSTWSEDRLRQHLSAEARRPFDLAVPPLARATLLRGAADSGGGDEHVLMLVLHHIVADFWSLAVLLEELGEIVTGGQPTTPAPVRYTDWVRWDRERLAGAAGEALAGWWTEHLGGRLEPLDVATDRPRPPVQTWNGGTRRAHLDPAAAAALQGHAGRAGATLYTTLLAAWQALLHRLTGQPEVLVGSPSSGRERPHLAGLVGYFVNPLVLLGDLSGAPAWKDHLERTRRTVLDAFRHAELPFDLLVERLRPERRADRSPVFQVFFTLQQAPRLRAAGLDAFATGQAGARLELAGLEWTSIELASHGAQFDLALSAAEHGGSIALALTYNSDLFEATTGDRLLGQLRQLVAAAVDGPDRPVRDLPLLAPAQRHQMLAEWNATAAAIPAAGLFQLVAAQARRSPAATALVAGDQALTFAELVERARRLAGHLRQLGVGPEVPVGLCVDRSAEMVVALLGILAAGGAWVPLDPSHPEDRLAWMLEDALAGVTPRLLLTRRADRRRLGAVEERADRVVLIGEDEAAAVTPVAADPEALAYVIYTSGSTGRPKGVQVCHRAVVNFLTAMRRRPGLGPHDTLLAVTTLSFDISILEIFLPLTAGARLVLPGREAAADGARLARQLEEHAVTVMQATPSTWRLLLESGWAGRRGLTLLSGGEALPSDLAARLRPLGAALWNLYGPTETTVWSAVRSVRAGEDPVRVGGVIANTRLQVLDEHLAPRPVGQPGEVWIGGAGLARGYLGRPGLTAERFVPDPLTGGPPGERLYRVGDRARWLADGELELLGRTDHQVKVRGYRIELGEVESALAGHPGIAQGVVVVHRREAADPRLIAWLVAAGPAPAAAELRGFLRRDLPDYMLPSAFVAVDELPHTANGKVDRGALARRAPATPGDGAAAGETLSGASGTPRTSLERTIAELWCEVLGVERVGVDESFFDLGGHSLLVTRLHGRLVERLERPDLTVVDLFQYPTVGALARFLAPDTGAAPAVVAPAVAAPRSAAPGRQAVAIVGMAGRFPGAADVAAFWRNLRAGVEAISFFTDDELRGQVSAELLADRRYVRARGVLAGAEDFDAAFFGLTPREAEVMDPQHRLFLECAWESLEHAGYDPARYGGRIGLFAGVGMNTYLLHAGEERLSRAAGSYQAFISNDKDFVPTRVSYKLDLRGPSINVQTACSSSLVAVHLACQSLFSGESDMALAGGVTVRVPQVRGYVYEEGGILSSDGHCRAFDAGAGGTVLGNGVGIVVLKPLAAARADGDRVLAVIKGSAINNDGSQKVGYTAPSVEGQVGVIRAALAAAGVEPESIGYVEAHGTGTPLGDPIEVAALTQVFAAGPGAAEKRPPSCALGSVKTNIGHLDTAAGVAGLIKTVEALRHRELPPSLHFTTPNPRIPFADSPFRVSSQLAPWEAGETPRRAGVSSFGIGGTNAHLVLEEAPESPPESPPSSPPRPWQLLLLSARTAAALEAASDRLAERLAAEDAPELADAAYTLQVGRHRFDHRRWLLAESRDGAAKALARRDPEQVRGGPVRDPEERRVRFLFSGQGAQYLGMGQQLYTSEPRFRQEVDRCAEALRGELGVDLRGVLYPDLEGFESPAGGAPAAAELLRQTRLTQPALFTVEYALARLWMAWGVAPAAMLGHSIGELVAATVAGVFPVDDALRLVAARGRLMGEQPAGAMLAVGLAEDELVPRLPPEVQLAAVNGPADGVVSGPATAIDAFEEQLTRDRDEVRCRRLHTSHAFHSAMMQPAVAPFVRQLEEVQLTPPSLPFVSNVTGTWITDEEATDPAYWGRHLVAPVRFAAGVATLAAEPGALLEVGPGHSLATLARPQAPGRLTVASLPHPQDREGAERVLLGALGRLWQSGVEIDWSSFYGGRQERRRRVELPSYPFERRPFWIEADRPAPLAPRRDALAPKDEVGDWIYTSWWMPAPLDAPPLDAPQDGAQDEAWLVLASGEGLLGQLPERLAAAGRRIVRVLPEEIDPTRREDYSALLAKLGTAPWHTVYAGEEPFGLLALVQALARLEGESPIHLSIVTRQAFRVEAGEPVDAAAATLWGIARTVPQELPRLLVRMIDIGRDFEGEDLEDLARELLATSRQAEVALRPGGRYRRVFEPFPLTPASGPSPRLASGGPWLVTGGLGGVGQTLARTLAESVAGSGTGDGAAPQRSPVARLVLLGRSELPPRPDWPDWLDAHGEGDPTSRKIRGVLALEARGAEVLTVAADVTDRAALDGALASARERFGPLRGVIHAAGVAGGGQLASRRPEDALAVLGPKVEGTRALLEALSGDPLDFVLLCSSINAVTGGWGQADYAAANVFLDAFAAERSQRRGPLVVSLGWDRWRGVGMAGASPLGASHPLLGQPVVRLPGRAVYRAVYSPDTHWVLAEHEIAGRPTVPGATYIEMARAAWAGDVPEGSVELSEVVFLEPLVVDAGRRREVLTVLDHDADSEADSEPDPEPGTRASGPGGARFRILSRPLGDPEAPWQEHSRGRVGRSSTAAPAADLSALGERLGGRITAAQAVARSSRGFLVTGRRWQGLTEVREEGDELLATIALADDLVDDLAELGLHPALLDIAVGYVQLVQEGDYLPLSYERLSVLGPLPARLSSHLSVRARGDVLSCDAVLYDAAGRARATVEGFAMKRVGASALEALGAAAPEPGIEAAPARPEDVVLEGAIAPADAAEVLRRVLAARHLPPHLVVTPRDLEAVREAYRRFDPSRLAAELAELAPAEAVARQRPDLDTAWVAPEEGLEAVIAETWERFLGIPSIGVHDNFFELGGTSLLGVQVVGELKRRLGREIATVSLFEAPTVAALAKHLAPDEDAEPAFAKTKSRVARKKAALAARQQEPRPQSPSSRGRRRRPGRSR